MLALLKSELDRVGPIHIARIIKKNKSLFDFVVEQTSHLQTKNISEQIYLVINELKIKPVCYCDKDLNFNTLTKGYYRYCSIKCSKNSIETKKSFSEKISNRNNEDRRKISVKRTLSVMLKYGVDNISKSEEIKEKIKQTNLKRYGVDNISQSVEIQEKIKQTNLKRYGAEWSFQSEEIKEKIKQTNLDRYGCENPHQSEEIKEKIKQTNLDRYGCKNPCQSEEIKEKIKQTILERYGVEYPLQSEEIQEKRKQTYLEKYGVENPRQSEEIQKKTKQTNLEKYGVEFSIQSTSIKEKIKHINFQKMVEKLKHVVTPRFGIEIYKNVCIQHRYEWTCVKCNHDFIDHLVNGRIPRCAICYPRLNGISQMEIDIFNNLNIENKIQSDRTILNGKELDIYLPDKHLAIEFDGIFWHSELNGIGKNYHLDKTKQCEQQGIQLIHIFENEWVEKQNIVKSIINAKLRKFEYRIYARKCKIKEIDSKIKNEFLEENHLQGDDKSSIKLGLYYKNELVSVMTFGKSRYNKNYEFEMHRYCSKLNYQIVGGASKILTYFIKTYESTSIITYADRRYSNGKFYEHIGFRKIRESDPNYFYFKGNSGLLSRIQFQKHKLKDKLEKFNPELTEWENMQMSGYDRIWDCGNFVFELDQKNFDKNLLRKGFGNEN